MVADARALAEDALRAVTVDYEELPAVTDMETALDPATPVIHPELGDNLAFERKLEAGDVDGAFAKRRRGGRGTLPVRPPHRRDRWSRARSSPTTTRPSIA